VPKQLRKALVAFGFAALASTVAALPTLSNVAVVAADATVVVDTEEVLQSNWLGVGVQWDPAEYQVPTYSDAQWQMITSRVDYMKPKFARVMIGMTDYVTGVDGNGNFTYDFNSGQMQRLYRILDYAQAHGVTVMFGEWNKPGYATSYDDRAGEGDRGLPERAAQQPRVHGH